MINNCCLYSIHTSLNVTVNDTENTHNSAVPAKIAVCKSNGNEINVRENRKEQTRMDNPEKLATLGT